MSFQTVIEETKVRHLNLPSPPTVDSTATVREAIRQMQNIRCACALVVDAGRLVGIFTERDVLNKIVGKHALLEKPVREFMTPDPVTLTTDDTLEEVIKVMSEGGYRHIPIVDAAGHAVASLSASEIVKYIVAHFPQDVYNLPPRPDQHMATPDGA